MDPIREFEMVMSRRELFGRSAMGVGSMALHTLLRTSGLGAVLAAGTAMGAPQKPHIHLGKPRPGLPGMPNFAPKAKRVIMLFMNGGPSQMDLLDPKPMLDKHHGRPLFDKIAGKLF